MLCVIFTASIAALVLYGHLRSEPPVAQAAWLFALFISFQLVCLLLFRRTIRPLRDALRFCLAKYEDVYGETSTGQRFLANTPAWYEGWFEHGVDLSLQLSDWHLLVIGGVIEFIGKFFDSQSTADQKALEEQIKCMVMQEADIKAQHKTYAVLLCVIFALGLASCFGLTRDEKTSQPATTPALISERPSSENEEHRDLASKVVPDSAKKETATASLKVSGNSAEALHTEIRAADPRKVYNLTRVSIRHANGVAAFPPGTEFIVVSTDRPGLTRIRRGPYELDVPNNQVTHIKEAASGIR